jgi:hypothetical protein
MHFIRVVTLATNLVTGNGFGFAVVSPETATITRFYAHPYSFSRPDPKNPLGEGIETANFIQSLRFSCGAGQKSSAEYAQDSHVIGVRCGASTGTVFMPFGFAQAALIIRWEPDLQVVWSHPVQSRSVLRVAVTRSARLGVGADCGREGKRPGASGGRVQCLARRADAPRSGGA